MMKKTFKPKKHHFKNGIEIDINEHKITISEGKDKKTLNSENIDNFSQREYFKDLLTPGGLMFWTPVITGVFVILVEMLFGGWSTFSWGFFLVMLLINILAFIILIIDALLELNLFRMFIRKFLSTESIRVTIGNKSGNNLDFLVYPEEHTKVVQLEKTVEELRKYKNEIHQSANSKATSSLDELEKLASLRDKGVITEGEFNLKKKSLLGL
jgi:hypothetical protein